MKQTLGLYAILLAMGAGWGLTIPLGKIAVGTGHQPVGLVFWQLIIVIICLGAVTLARGRRPTFRRAYLRLFVMVALCGAVLPDMVFYAAAAHLPGGVMAIVISSVAMFSLPIAVLLRNERFEWRRLGGVALGLLGIVLLVGPETSLPNASAAGFVLLALAAPALYATEGNLVAKWGTQGLDPMQVIIGASIVGTVITGPAAVVSGQWINPLAGFGAAEAALVAGAALHAVVYACYVWMVGRAGSVFAAQTSYMVTATGVVWSMTLLGESYAIWVWLALAMMLGGMFLVQPRAARVLVPGRVMSENAANNAQTGGRQ